MRHIVLAASIALGLTACAAPYDPALPPSDPATAGPAFTLTSPDFADGGQLPDWATASAFGGQCVGDNINPALEWSGVPEGTQSFAVVLIDRSADDFVHWVHFDIPADSTGVPKGGSADLAGSEGAKSKGAPDVDGYFGPCPPGPDHRYEFTVYALNAPLGLDDQAGFADVTHAIEQRELAQASVTGVRSGPA